MKNSRQYIANILIKPYIAHVEQYIAHFMVDEKIFQMIFLHFFRVRLTELEILGIEKI